MFGILRMLLLQVKKLSMAKDIQLHFGFVYKVDLMKCRKEDEDLLSIFIRKKGSCMSLKKDFSNLSKKNLQL
jgi:hypothetical protein